MSDQEPASKTVKGEEQEPETVAAASEEADGSPPTIDLVTLKVTWSPDPEQRFTGKQRKI